jgi:hypothetical protein
MPKQDQVPKLKRRARPLRKRMLMQARNILQKARLLQDEAVVTYLGSTEDVQNEQAPGPASNDDDEFS